MNKLIYLFAFIGLICAGIIIGIYFTKSQQNGIINGAFKLYNSSDSLYGYSQPIFTMNDINPIKVRVDCNGILDMYNNSSERLNDLTGITIWIVSYCYDWKNGKLNETYENEKWRDLNGYWTLDNKSLGVGK